MTDNTVAMTRKKPIKWVADDEGWWVDIDGDSCCVFPANDNDVASFAACVFKEDKSYHLDTDYKSLKTAKRAALNLFEQLKAEEAVPSP
jgi:hypothetical protein